MRHNWVSPSPLIQRNSQTKVKIWLNVVRTENVAAFTTSLITLIIAELEFAAAENYQRQFSRAWRTDHQALQATPAATSLSIIINHSIEKKICVTHPWIIKEIWKLYAPDHVKLLSMAFFVSRSSQTRDFAFSVFDASRTHWYFVLTSISIFINQVMRSSNGTA